MHVQEVFIADNTLFSADSFTVVFVGEQRRNTYYRNDPGEYDLSPASDRRDFIYGGMK